ncbi:hypothetical protein BDF14DRAFT_1720235 [Spinellus fusiger]|nr:hypothetical protein BDF14DRAFT_1720235 [Spinellus fusiger]
MTDLADDPSTAVSQEKTPDKEEISRQLQRLQEKLQLQGEEALEMDMNEPKDQQQTWQRFSFGYITLQVILAHFKAMWVYLTALFTHSQERYQQLTRHQQLTRRVRLAEPMMRLLHSALLIERTIVIDWVWRNFSMFLWPLMRIFGVGVLVDK